MAKKGQFNPWRVKFTYPSSDRVPDGITATHSAPTEWDMVHFAAQALRRGATVELAAVDPQTRKSIIVATMTPEDLGAPEDEDWPRAAGAADYDEVQKRLGLPD